MFGFLIGLGVFWLLVWTFIFIVGVVAKEEWMQGWGVLGVFISLFYLFSVAVGRLVAGI